MPTRNVVLTEHQAALVEDLVASGRYQNASEVLRDGLRFGTVHWRPNPLPEQPGARSAPHYVLALKPPKFVHGIVCQFKQPGKLVNVLPRQQSGRWRGMSGLQRRHRPAAWRGSCMYF